MFIKKLLRIAIISFLIIVTANISYAQSDYNDFKENEWYFFNIEAREEIWITLNVEEGEAYDIFIIDSYNNRNYNDLIDRNQVIRAVWFAIYEEDKLTPYASESYVIKTESNSRNVVGGYTNNDDNYSATINANGNVIHIFIQGSEARYTGTFGFKYIKRW